MKGKENRNSSLESAIDFKGRNSSDLKVYPKFVSEKHTTISSSSRLKKHSSNPNGISPGNNYLIMRNGAACSQ